MKGAGLSLINSLFRRVKGWIEKDNEETTGKVAGNCVLLSSSVSPDCT
jgi:hypothetical protein